MQLDIDTEIRFRTGQRAGVLRNVLLGEDNQVANVIMSTGGLISREVAVPLDALSEGEGGVLYIDLDPDQIDELPAYAEERVPAVTGEWEFTQQASAIGEVFPITTYQQVLPVTEVPTIDDNMLGNVIQISQGTEVDCLDGRWGIVDEVVVDDGGRTTAFVGRPDDISQRDRLIPMDLVQDASSDVVLLNCQMADLETYTQALTGEQEEPDQ